MGWLGLERGTYGPSNGVSNEKQMEPEMEARINEWLIGT